MNITIETPAEAFATIAAMVISADKIGTLEEKKFLFENVRELDIFKDYSDDDFVNLMVNINEKIQKYIPLNDMPVSHEAIYHMCNSIKAVLSEEHILKAYTMACELACTDGLVESEKIMINQFKTELGIDNKVAQEIMDRANQA